jgi:sialic acid synthase SpsE
MSARITLGRKFRRSLYAVTGIGSGQELIRDGVRSIRPGAIDQPAPPFGGAAGRGQAPVVERGTPLAWELIQ